MGSATRWRQPTGVWTSALIPGVPGSTKDGLVSASAKRAAESNRSAGNFSNAFPVAAATCGGTDFRSSATGRTSSATIYITIACADAPVCGGSPVNISYNTLPNE